MTLHELKCWPEPFAALHDRVKTYEIRRDDRGFAVGDQLRLREWNPDGGAYTGLEVFASVRYLSRGPDWGLPVGLVVMAVEVTATIDRCDVCEEFSGEVRVRPLMTREAAVCTLCFREWYEGARSSDEIRRRRGLPVHGEAAP